MESTAYFTSKLDTLAATLDLLHDYRQEELATSLASSRGKHVVAVGSGGSAIVAEYLARCRDTLGLGPTTVQTPMQFVFEHHDLSGSDVWLFSAGGDNGDAIAAVQAATARHAGRLTIMTRNPAGAATALVRVGGGAAHVIPVAEAKDGYLATHSLLSSTVALLLAGDAICGDPRGSEILLETVASRLLAMRDPYTRTILADSLSGLSSFDTIIVAADPSLRPLAVLLDTSIWEASLCHVQTTDFRNLAHGRHAWLHHRASSTLVLALTTVDSRGIWSAIEGFLPERPRRLVLDHSGGGRMDNALSIVDGLGLVEAIGVNVRIDPGKPGIGEFGRAIYGDGSLEDLASKLPARVRHKRAAVARLDTGEHGGEPLHAIWRDRMDAFASTDIGGAVFDYDGTLVGTEDRWKPPGEPIVEELVRLHGAGIRIGIATGRGGSAGEELRKILPEQMLKDVLIGYYNGGCLRTADVDLALRPPTPDPAIVSVADWLDDHPELFVDERRKVGPIQITIGMSSLAHRYRFPIDLAGCPAVSTGAVRVAASGHSYDLVPAGTSKLSVVDALRQGMPRDLEILRFGDSGARSGNDNALLSHAFGISVGEICGAPSGCWSLLGTEDNGPVALLRILRALIPSERGGIRLDIASLGLDVGGRASI